MYTFLYNNKNIDSFTIACIGKTSILESKFFPPIQLNGKYQLGLKNLYSYNSIFNIKEPNKVLYYYEEKTFAMPKGEVMEMEEIKSLLAKSGYALIKSKFGHAIIAENHVILNKGLASTLKSNMFDRIVVYDDMYYYEPKERKEIVLTPGIYEVSEIEAEIKKTIPGVVLTGDNKTMRCKLYAPVVFDFDTEGFGKSLLGFRGMSIPNIKITSETRVNINNINVIRVHCNIVSGSYINGKENHSVYDFYPIVPPGFMMVEVLSNIIYYPIDVGSIDTFTVSLRDQNDELVDFNGEEVTINFHIKKIG